MDRYSNADELWRAMLEDCLAGEIVEARNGEILEHAGPWVGQLERADRSMPTQAGDARGLSLAYAGAEVLWYLSLTGDIEMIRHYAPSYPKWCDEDEDESGKGRKILFGGVGDRLRGSEETLIDAGYDCGSVATIEVRSGYEAHCRHGQLAGAIALLKERPTTRRCVISLWRSSDLAHAIIGDKANLPCYVSLQYTLRQGRLDALTHMRSNDAWLGSPYDVFAFCCLQQLIADERAARVVDTTIVYAEALGASHGWAPAHPESDGPAGWCGVEEAVRTGMTRVIDADALTLAKAGGGTMGADLFLAALTQLSQTPEVRRAALAAIRSPRLRALGGGS
jgi:thymidylate synthase